MPPTATLRRTPLFVYLLEAPGGHSYIGLASNPLRREHCHNRLFGLGSSSKTTRLAAPHWRLVLVIGPFYRGARRFHREWRHEARQSLPARLLHGYRKAALYRRQGLRVWSPAPDQVLPRLRSDAAAAAASHDPPLRCAFDPHLCARLLPPRMLHRSSE